MARDRYATLIEADYRAYIDSVNASFPPDIGDKPIGEQRAAYDRMARAFYLGRPAGVAVEDGTIHLRDRTIPLRRYSGGAPAAVVAFYHGGGFVLGGLDSHDDVCAELCAATGFDVVSVDYRLAPEHPHPAAFEDALAAFNHLAATGTAPIVLCGDSAGGSLAAAVAHASRGSRHAAAGQVLIYPDLGGPLTSGSYLQHADAPLLSTADVAYYRNMRMGGAAWVPTPVTAPLSDSNFGELPPTVIVPAEYDPLASDGPVYRDRILAAGGRAVNLEQAGLTHSFLRARGAAPRAAAALRQIADAVSALGRGAWPY